LRASYLVGRHQEGDVMSRKKKILIAMGIAVFLMMIPITVAAATTPEFVSVLTTTLSENTAAFTALIRENTKAMMETMCFMVSAAPCP